MALCAAGSVLAAQAAVGQSASGWSQLQGGPEHAGVAPAGAPAPALARTWRLRVPGAGRLSAPVVVSDSLAVSVSSTGVLGFDPGTGELSWNDVPRAGGPLAQPAVDPTTGTLAFTEGDSPTTSALAALTLTARRRAWTVRLDDLARAAPTISGGAVYVGTRAGSVYALDVATGKVRWTRKLDAAVDVAPAVSGDLVYVLTQNSTDGKVRLFALHASTGKNAWSYSPRGVALDVSSPTVAGGRVYVGFGDATVRAFDARTGRISWTQPVRGFFTAASPLAVRGDAVYALDEAGGVYRFDARTGDRVWDYQFPSFVTWSAPLVTSSAIYVGTNDGTFAALDPVNGHLRWRAPGLSGPTGAIVPVGDSLLVPIVAGGGGIAAYAHDPSRALLDLDSPTELDRPLALANYMGAFLVMLFLLLGLFRGVFRPRLDVSRPQPIPVPVEPREGP